MSRANRLIGDGGPQKIEGGKAKAKTDHIRHQASGISHQPSKEGEQTTFVTLQLPAISHQPQPSPTIGSFLGFLDLSDSKINHKLHCRMARSNFANLVLAVLLVAGPAALTTAYVVPPSASRIGSLAGGSSFSASVAPRVSDVRHASSSSSADMTMRLSVPSALRSFNKKFRGASAAGSSSNSRIGMSDEAAAAEPEDEKKSILQKVSIETCVSCYRANTLIRRATIIQ
jgi:hypothetical protein